MTVSSNLGAYLQLKLSGGINNEDSNSSLGGQVSSKTILSQSVATFLNPEPTKRFSLSSSTISSKRKTKYYVDGVSQEFVNGRCQDPFLLGLTWIDTLPTFFQNLSVVGLDPATSYSIFLRRVTVSQTLTEYYAILVPDVFADFESMTDVTTQIAGTRELLFNSIPWSFGIGYPTWTKYFFNSNGDFTLDLYTRKVLSITSATVGQVTTYTPSYSSRIALPDSKTLNGYVEVNLAFSFSNGASLSTLPVLPEFDNCCHVFTSIPGSSSFKKFSEVVSEVYKKNTYSVSNVAASATDTSKPEYKFNTGLTGINVIDAGGWEPEESFSIVYDLGNKRCAILEDRWQKNLNVIQVGSTPTFILESTQDLDIETHGWTWGDWTELSVNGKYKMFNATKSKWVTIDIVTALLPQTGVRFQVTDITSSNKKNELFDSVKRYESHFGDTEYRCFFVTNTHLTETMWDIKIFINSQPVSKVDTLQMGLDPASVGDGFTTGIAVTVADENTAPAGVTFTTPSRLNPLVIGDLAPLKCKAVWVKRIVPAGVEVDVWDDWSSIGVSGLI